MLKENELSLVTQCLRHGTPLPRSLQEKVLAIIICADGSQPSAGHDCTQPLPQEAAPVSASTSAAMGRDRGAQAPMAERTGQNSALSGTMAWQQYLASPLTAGCTGNSVLSAEGSQPGTKKADAKAASAIVAEARQGRGEQAVFVEASQPDGKTAGAQQSCSASCADMATVDAVTEGAVANVLVGGDNLGLLNYLASADGAAYLAQRGGLKLIYIDPPFNVGGAFYMQSQVSLDNGEEHSLTQQAYADAWAQGAFFRMLHERLVLMRHILADDGSLFLHCDWRTSAYARLLLDAVFGAEHFRGEIIWHYTGGGRSSRYFSRKHDTIFHYSKSTTWLFTADAVRVPYKQSSAYGKNGIVSKAGKFYAPHPLGTPVDDVWDIPIVNPLAKERLGYPTQKPELLLERIIGACSRPGDLVADFFCGSGTTLAVAQKMGRPWLGCDAGALAIRTSQQRLGTCPGAGTTSLLLSTAPAQRLEIVQTLAPAQATARTPQAIVRHDYDQHTGTCRVMLEDFFLPAAVSAAEVEQKETASARQAASLLPEQGLHWLTGWAIGLMQPPAVPMPKAVAAQAVPKAVAAQAVPKAVAAQAVPKALAAQAQCGVAETSHAAAFCAAGHPAVAGTSIEEQAHRPATFYAQHLPVFLPLWQGWQEKKTHSTVPLEALCTVAVQDRPLLHLLCMDIFGNRYCTPLPLAGCVTKE